METSMKKQLFQLTWPIFIESVLFTLLGIADVVMLGKFSDNAAGAIGIVNQIISMFTIMFTIITSGTMIICVQYLGAAKPASSIRKLVSGSLLLNSFIGVIISGIIFFFTSPLLSIMDVEPVYWNYCYTYLKFVGSTLFIQAIANTFTAVLRAHSETRLCMFITIFMNLLNIFGNFTFIYGNFHAPRLGVFGAALSTVSSKLIGLFILGYFTWKKVLQGFTLSDISPFPKKEIKDVLKLGTPAAGESIAYNASKLVITAIIIQLGSTAVDTNSYANSITMFVYIFAVAVGQGTSIMVGRLVGEKKNESAYRLCFSSFYFSFAVTIFISLFVLCLSHPIFNIFTEDASIIALGTKLLAVDILVEMGRCANVVIINCLRAAGDVKFPVYIGILSMWGIGVFLGYIFSVVLHWGMPGLWLALGLDESIRGIIMYFRWKKKKWHGKACI